MNLLEIHTRLTYKIHIIDTIFANDNKSEWKKEMIKIERNYLLNDIFINRWLFKLN